MQNTKPVSIRIDDALDARIAAASEKAGIPKTDVMRIALGLGVKDLEMIDCDLMGAISDRVARNKESLESKDLGSRTSSHPKVKRTA